MANSAAQIQDIKKLVVTHWNKTYKGDEEPPPAPESSRRGKVSDFIVTLSLNNNSFIQMKSKWVRTQDPDDSQDPDTISTYLTDPVIKSSSVKEAGAVMKYWH